ncbi:hypothetical protein VTK26DRAFT_2518 [Humicola hyalothermophila]
MENLALIRRYPQYFVSEKPVTLMAMGSDEEPTGSAQSSREYAWSACGDKAINTRVFNKQQAVDDGFAYARQLCSVFCTAYDHVGPGHAMAFDLMGGYEIRSWIEELDKEDLIQVEMLRPHY